MARKKEKIATKAQRIQGAPGRIKKRQKKLGETLCLGALVARKKEKIATKAQRIQVAPRRSKMNNEILI